MAEAIRGSTIMRTFAPRQAAEQKRPVIRHDRTNAPLALYEAGSFKNAKRFLMQSYMNVAGLGKSPHALIEGHAFRDGAVVMYFHSTLGATYEAVTKAAEKFGAVRQN